MTTYEMTVTFPEASLKELRDQIAARAKLVVIQNQLRQDVERVSEELQRIANKACEDLSGLGFSYVEELSSYLDDLEPGQGLIERVDEMISYGWFQAKSNYFQGNVYRFLEDNVEIEASFSSEQLPRLAKCDKPWMVEFSPQTGEALMRTQLRYNDDPHEEFEHFIIFRIKPEEEGPFRVTAEIE